MESVFDRILETTQLHWRSRQGFVALNSQMEQERQEARDVPAAEVMKRPVVLPETFNGEGNWTKWFDHV